MDQIRLESPILQNEAKHLLQWGRLLRRTAGVPNKSGPDLRNHARPTVVLSQERMRKQMGSRRQVPPYWRPQVRGDCRSGPRPCPYVGCKYHLASDVLPDGSLRLAFGEDVQALSEMKETCALDVAEQHDMTLDRLAELSNLTRERVRQIEVNAVATLKSRVGRCDD